MNESRGMENGKSTNQPREGPCLENDDDELRGMMNSAPKVEIDKAYLCIFMSASSSHTKLIPEFPEIWLPLSLHDTSLQRVLTTSFLVA